MTGRESSAAALRQIEDAGLLSRMRFETYKALCQLGAATAGEISNALTENGTPAGGGRAGPGNVSARLVELRELGVVREIGQRTCKITGRDVILWDVTGELPTGQVMKYGPVRPKPAVMRAALGELRELVVFAQERGFRIGTNLASVAGWIMEKFER